MTAYLKHSHDEFSEFSVLMRGGNVNAYVTAAARSIEPSRNSARSVLMSHLASSYRSK